MLANPFDRALQLEAQLRGLGGISLGIAEEVLIGHNRIEHNRTRHFDPVCGVFVALGEGVEIYHNLVVENGVVGPRPVRR